MVYDIEVLE